LANEEKYGDRFAEGERSSLEGYQAYDMHYEKIGKVDDLFVDDLKDRARYVGVKTGLLGTRTTLIPIELVRINDKRKLIEVEVDKNTIKEGPTFGDDREITPEFEQRVLSYYRAEITQTSSAEREADVAHYPNATGDWRVDLQSGERLTETRGHSGEEDWLSGARSGTGRESVEEFGSEDELRVQRVEEKLRADTRDREVGGVRVRKRVRTDRERLAVPKKRQEVRVERVPVEEGAASEDEIGDDEIRVPVVEEEIVVEKRPVVKEEIRLRKEIVEEEDVVEENVRKEEVDIDDRTERRNA
jgi:uncharacterized protein (TIGR02271 family)